jgi:hypothetical protein
MSQAADWLAQKKHAGLSGMRMSAWPISDGGKSLSLFAAMSKIVRQSGVGQVDVQTIAAFLQCSMTRNCGAAANACLRHGVKIHEPDAR